MSVDRRASTLDAMNGSDVQATVREMWDTRPTRPQEGRKIAGVAAAVARRYDLDQVLVRVAFVAAAITGVGVPLYILGWGLLPGEPGGGGLADRKRPRTWVLVALGVAAALSVIGTGPGGILLPLAAVAALLFLLHRSRGRRGLAAAGTPSTAADGLPPVSEAGAAVVGERTTPPAWDPLGAAPFAWDLPEPGPAPAPPPRRRSKVTPVTLAVALLAGGVTALVLLAAGGVTDLPVLFGVLLAVLGAGLVVGAYTRSGRGLIPVALLVGGLTWGALAAPLDRIDDASTGELRVAPVSAAALAPRYEHAVGAVEMDLRDLDLSVPPNERVTPVATRIEAGMGSVDIQVPENADVRFTGTAGLGSVEFDDREVGGPNARLTVDDLGEDGVRSGRPLVLDVHAGMGSVAVHRD
jgi:phage shock protein PspC (stress-responsive transcriptional regulator)